MTVQTTTTYQTFAGGQSILTFNFRTLVSNPNYINVLVTNLSNNTTSILTYGTNYTVAVNTTGVGGTVTVSPTYSTGYQYTVYRSTGEVQNSSYANFNQFPASTLENGLDQLTMLIQEISTSQGLTIQFPLGLNPTISTTLPSPVASEALGWDPTGTRFINLPLAPSGATGAIGPSGSTGSVSSVSSSTSDITVVSTSTTPIITAVNAATAGTSSILRVGTDGFLHTYYAYVKVSETQAQNTQPGTAGTGSFLNRNLNTLDSDTGSIVIGGVSSGTIKLPVGTYIAKATSPFSQVNNVQIRLQNIAGTGATLLIGNSGYSQTGQSQMIYESVSGEFTLTSQGTIALQYQAGHSTNTSDLGNPANYTTEVYSVLELIKIS